MSSSTRTLSLLLAVPLLVATALAVHACIIPDTYIQVRTTDENLHGVRIVEGIPLDEPARAACDPNNLACPMPDATGLPHFLDPANDSFKFCVCSENKIDDNRLGGVLFYAEDADEEEGSPRDSLYGVLLLDWSPTLGESAFDYVAYRSYLDARDALDLYFSSYETTIIKRPRPWVRSMTLNDETGHFDLCNGAGRVLAPGDHTLTLMVTDRPWFTTEPLDGGTETGLDTMAVTLEGVPDISAGATYDIETYVFHCFEEGDEECNCVEPA